MICEGRRAAAVKAGAIEVTSDHTWQMIRRRRGAKLREAAMRGDLSPEEVDAIAAMSPADFWRMLATEMPAEDVRKLEVTLRSGRDPRWLATSDLSMPPHVQSKMVQALIWRQRDMGIELLYKQEEEYGTVEQGTENSGR